MKIIIVGASGRIGKEVDKALSGNHDIIRVGAHSGDVQCDYTSPDSVRNMFEKIGEFDSLITKAPLCLQAVSYVNTQTYSIATGPLNAAVDTFVQNTATLLPRGIRVNVVSPAPIVEPEQEAKGVVTASETAKLYVDAIETNITGKVLRAWGGLPFVPQ